VLQGCDALVLEDLQASAVQEFLASLRDGREVWVHGERVPDVTSHPAFRNSAGQLARLYDALHDPAQRDILTVPTDTGGNGYTHAFFTTPRHFWISAAKKRLKAA